MAIIINYLHPPKHIVRVEYDPNAPTGEGRILVDELGTRWREVMHFTEPQGTGDRRAYSNGYTIRELS